MTETQSPTASSSRMAAFEREVADMNVKGGTARFEDRLMALGAVLAVVGIVLVVVGWYQASGTAALNDQISYLISCALVGLGLVTVGAAMFVRYSLGRTLRYWLIREIHEQRQQTDRVVEALARIEQKLEGRS